MPSKKGKKNEKKERIQVNMAHACNLSYSGGRNQRIWVQSQPLANSL
jgi:hypothetical protein